MAFGAADLILELARNLQGRSSANFLAQTDNRTSVIPKGSRGKVLDVQQFNSQNFGVKLEILDSKKEGEEVWVYYNLKDPGLALQKTCAKNSEALKAEAIKAAGCSKAKRDIAALQDPDFVAHADSQMKNFLVALENSLRPSEIEGSLIPRQGKVDCGPDCQEAQNPKEKTEKAGFVSPRETQKGVREENHNRVQACMNHQKPGTFTFKEKTASFCTSHGTVMAGMKMEETEEGRSFNKARPLYIDYQAEVPPTGSGKKLKLMPNVPIFLASKEPVNEGDAEAFVKKLRARCEPMIQKVFGRYGIEIVLNLSWHTDATKPGYRVNSAAPYFNNPERMAPFGGPNVTPWDCVDDCYGDKPGDFAGNCTRYCGAARADRDYCAAFMQHVGNKLGLEDRYTEYNIPSGCSKQQLTDTTKEPKSLMYDASYPIQDLEIMPAEIQKILDPVCKPSGKVHSDQI
ncbi:hypothetical protein K2X30_01370 [bacterium]|nr:hypothetical protein [bacterium]